MTSSGATPPDSLFEAHALHPIDTSHAKDGLWLVKVPNYLADLWLKSKTERVVGKVVISNVDGVPSDVKQKSDVRVVTNDGLIAEAGEDGRLIPREHQFLIQNCQVSKDRRGHKSGQELVVICEEVTQLSKDTSFTGAAASTSVHRPRSGKRYSIFGRVNTRAECQPPPNANYMKLKSQQVKAKNRARHEVRVLDKPVQTHPPLANHAVNLEYEMRKKREGKNLRREKDDVMQDIFKAFEKHQYYAFKDLLNLTQQPVTYLTTILKEIAIFNTKPPHQHMWELRPEYRHYGTTKTGEKSAGDGGGSLK